MSGYEFPGKGRGAVRRTCPETISEDYARLLDLVEYQNALDSDTLVSWQIWYPG